MAVVYGRGGGGLELIWFMDWRWSSGVWVCSSLWLGFYGIVLHRSGWNKGEV